MQLILKFRERLSGLLQVVQDELDNIIAAVRTWSNVEHLDDGTHTANVGALISLTAGQAISIGQVVYVSSGADTRAPGQVFLADASSVTKSTMAVVRGIATTTASAGQLLTIRHEDVFSGLAGLTAGKAYYVSTTPGALTATKPTNAVLVGLALSTTDLLLLLTPPTSIAGSRLNWSGAATGSQDIVSGGTVSFTTTGTYTLTVDSNTVFTFKGAAGGAAGTVGGTSVGGVSAGAGGGGGGGGGVTTGTSVTLLAGKSYELLVGAASNRTRLKNTTDAVTLVDLNPGSGTTGGTVATGTNGVTGGAGGAGGSDLAGPANNDGAAGGNATNGAAGGGGGAAGQFNRSAGTGGTGGTGSNAGGAGGGANTSGANGDATGGTFGAHAGASNGGGGAGGAGGATFTGISGAYGAGGGGGGGGGGDVNNAGGAGGAGASGIAIFVAG